MIENGYNEDLTWGEWVKQFGHHRCYKVHHTPYIFDDRCRWDDVGDNIHEWYMMSKEERDECGLKEEYVLDKDVMMGSNAMCQNFIDHMDKGFEM